MRFLVSSVVLSIKAASNAANAVAVHSRSGGVPNMTLTMANVYKPFDNLTCGCDHLAELSGPRGRVPGRLSAFLAEIL